MTEIKKQIAEFAQLKGPISFGQSNAEWLLEGCDSASIWSAEDRSPDTVLKTVADRLNSTEVEAQKIAFLLMVNPDSDIRPTMHELSHLNECVTTLSFTEIIWAYLYNPDLPTDRFRVTVIETR